MTRKKTEKNEDYKEEIITHEHKEKVSESKDSVPKQKEPSLEKTKQDGKEKAIESADNRKLKPSVERKTPFEIELTDYERMYTDSFRKFSKIEYKNYIEGRSRYQEEIGKLRKELAIQKLTNKLFLALLWRILKTLK